MREIGPESFGKLWASYGAEHNVRLYQELLRALPDLTEALALAKKRESAPFQTLPERFRARLFEAAGDGFLERYAAWLAQNEIGVAFPSDAEYPRLLLEIHDPPSALFYKGRLDPEPTLPIAIVGARVCTPYGRDVAGHFAGTLASAGATVVSGLAAGIDSSAARGALDCADAMYPTVGVLGSGIDVVYPAGSEKLYAEVAERGAVITEFLPHTRPLRENFPIRNRIMSGLSRGVVVVEAGERSGTSITVGFALDQGRDVFAVPGRITDPVRRGTNELIRTGTAKPVFSVEDILTEYDRIYEPDTFHASAVRIPASGLPERERALVNVLSDGEKSVDELCERLPYSVGEINSSLTALEFSGIIKPLPGRMYALDTLRTLVIDE